MIKLLDAKKDRDVLYRIYKYENEVFGESGVGRYNISPFTKYGKTFAIYNDVDIISVVEIIFSKNHDMAYIYGVSTNEKYRFKGYATKLLNFAINNLKNDNIKYVELTVETKNEIANKLYAKMGFKNIECLENEYFDDNPRYLLRKEL
ncbi:GNAT family N-acetyltransferase [Caviibacter abscessus]|uniref:GNAT family N-acetyltransferase n=1 Tax=Caviibacter abscessus TaxID=1766719 RepID=UPI00082A0F06|nr:GNAT family N-acetyltransferase [Caviibacter abscessus]